MASGTWATKSRGSPALRASTSISAFSIPTTCFRYSWLETRRWWNTPWCRPPSPVATRIWRFASSRPTGPAPSSCIWLMPCPTSLWRCPMTSTRPRSREDLYADVIAELDHSVGRILQRLDDLDLSEDTLVIFTSDNGPWYGGSTGGLRGMKGKTWEGGLRVPLIARLPGVIPPGVVNPRACWDHRHTPDGMRADRSSPAGRPRPGRQGHPAAAPGWQSPEPPRRHLWNEGGGTVHDSLGPVEAPCSKPGAAAIRRFVGGGAGTVGRPPGTGRSHNPGSL